MIVGIVGAGVMGAGVAENLAQYRFHPPLVDHSESALDGGRRRIRASLRAARIMEKQGAFEAIDEVLGRIRWR